MLFKTFPKLYLSSYLITMMQTVPNIKCLYLRKLSVKCENGVMAFSDVQSLKISFSQEANGPYVSSK